MTIILGFVWIAWIIALLVLYHKVFTVYYFNLGDGLLREFVTALILGLIMAGLTFYLWWLTAIIIIAIGFAAMGKLNSNTPLIIAVVLAIIVAILGISFRASIDEDNNSSSAMNYHIVQEYSV